MRQKRRRLRQLKHAKSNYTTKPRVRCSRREHSKPNSGFEVEEPSPQVITSNNVPKQHIKCCRRRVSIAATNNDKQVSEVLQVIKSRPS